MMVRDEARLRQGNRNDQSHRGHQCSEKTLNEVRLQLSTTFMYQEFGNIFFLQFCFLETKFPLTLYRKAYHF